MKVLLTGGTGMVGSHLAKALLDGGHEVRCLVRRPGGPSLLTGLGVAQVAGDVTDPASLREAVDGVEAVVHTAGVVSYWRPKAPLMRQVNVEGTRALLDAAASAGVRRFLLTSSIAAVGYVDGDGIGDESTPYNWGPLDIAYCDTKAEAERLVLTDRRIEGVAVNPGIVFGPQDVYFNAGRMLVQVHRGELPGIPPGATTVCTARDVARGHLLALEAGRPGERYILGGYPITFVELFTAIGRVLGKVVPSRILSPTVVHTVAQLQAFAAFFTRKEPKVTPQLADLLTRNRRYHSRKAQLELGYSVSPLEPCLEATWRWYTDRGMV